MPVVKLQIPGELAYREIATRTVALVCRVATAGSGPVKPAYRDEFTNQLVSAVGEAFNNIAIHGYRNQTSREVVVVTSFDHAQVRVELQDHGASFDPSKVRAPDFQSLPESGMGLFIIRSFVDELEYAPGPPNVLVMTKFLSGDSCA